MRGTIGPYVVGLNYTVRHNTEPVNAHYFYLSRLENIPLTAIIQGESVELSGADGSVFHLHFVGNGSNGTQPLTFYNSVGLSGTWVLGPRSLPVKLTGQYSTANPGRRLYEEVTWQNDEAFEAMVKTARGAILKGDRSTLAKNVHFPLRVNFSGSHITVHGASELDASWSRIFTANFLAKIRDTVPHEMFVHRGQVMLGDGVLWFGSAGLESVNVM